MGFTARDEIKNIRGMTNEEKAREGFKIWVNNVPNGPTFNHLVYAFEQRNRRDLVERVRELKLSDHEIEAVEARKVSTSFCFNSGGEDCFE